MKKILFLVVLLATIKIQAQNYLSGYIRDKESKEVLPGAVVYFPELKNGTAAKADGSYGIGHLPKIKTIIQIKAVGYKTFVQQVDLAKVSTFDVLLEASVLEASEVVVTGVSKATEIKRSPIPIVVVDNKYISQNTATNAIDIISKTPGVSALTTGPNISKPFIRGLGYNRILTLFDGVRQEGQQWGDEHGIEMDQFLIDRVEVIKGPASLIYGSDALAGVVNMLPANPLPQGVIKGGLQSNYQTNNGLIANSFFIDGNSNGITWGGRASHKNAMDYQNKKDGRVYNTAFEETDFNVHAGINRRWGYSHLNLSAFDNLQEIPDGSRDSLTHQFTKQITEADTFRPVVPASELNSYKITTLHQRVQHYRAFLSNNFIIGQGKLAVNIGYQQSIRREYAHPQAPNVPGLFLVLNTETYDVKYYLPEAKGFEIVSGINGMYQTNNTNQATEFVIPNYKLFDFAPFVFVKKNIKKWDIAAGARYDTRSFKNSATYVTTNPLTGFDEAVLNNDTAGTTKQFGTYKHIFSGFSGSLGATYNVSEKLLFKVNIARGFRAPNISEISANGVHPGTGFDQLGNAAFKPEFSLQEDIGVFYDDSHISSSIELFNNNISNYIFNQKLQSKHGGDSTITQAGNKYPVFQYQQTNAQLYGGEARIDIHPHPIDWLHFENSLSVVYALNLGGGGVAITDSTKYLPYIPPVHTNSELRAEFKKNVSFFHNIYLKFDVQWYAAQNRAFTAYGTETPTGGYTLLSAGLGADIKNKKGNTLFTFSVLGTNLADVAYFNNMSRLKYFGTGIYSMGRNISFKLSIPISIKKAK
ncbi:MAG: TonB-dependent receptor [Bacteroidetes bacterium]|nr:TonB-dependent receptor [Bacteroidota bacterium]